MSDVAAINISFSDIPWRAHPEVWMLLVGLGAIAYYVVKVLQPKAVAAGYEPISKNSRKWFLFAVPAMWLASDWPVHDVAEEYLYSVHMAQHMVISMIVPAMLLLAMPKWLFELMLPEGGAGHRWLARLSRPLVAGLLFNALTMILHWTTVVQWSFESGALHFLFHLMIFAAGMLMWMPVIGPEGKWRLQPLSQCIYLFMMSIVPTVPGSWLVFAEDVVYRHYDTPGRLWGIDVLTDQQGAGLIMKLAGGFLLWGIILVIFVRWASAEAQRDSAVRREQGRVAIAAANARAEGTLTYQEVSETFARSAAPVEKPSSEG